VSNDEFTLADLAVLRAGLGLSRVTPIGLDGYLDKVVMKTRLAGAGVLVPHWVDLDRVGTNAAMPSPTVRTRPPSSAGTSAASCRSRR
jgi:hypothetical protein